jgi:hypothetical protein
VYRAGAWSTPLKVGGRRGRLLFVESNYKLTEERIRQAARRNAPTNLELLPLADDAQLAIDINGVHSEWDVAARMDSEGLETALRHQTVYNAAVTRLLQRVIEQNLELTKTINQIEAHLDRLGQTWSSDRLAAAPTDQSE